jgi:hypothetical protein
MNRKYKRCSNLRNRERPKWMRGHHMLKVKINPFVSAAGSLVMES